MVCRRSDVVVCIDNPLFFRSSGVCASLIQSALLRLVEVRCECPRLLLLDH